MPYRVIRPADEVVKADVKEVGKGKEDGKSWLLGATFISLVVLLRSPDS